MKTRIAGLFAFLLLGSTSATLAVTTILSEKDKLAIQGYETVKQALTEFRNANGQYPLRLAELKEAGFIKEFPDNPYKGGWKMEQVRATSFAPGMLIYHPFSLGGEKIDSYFLGVYGENIDWGRKQPYDEFYNPAYFAVIYGLGDDPLANALLSYSFSLTEEELANLKKKENRKKIFNLPQKVIDELDEKMKSIAQWLQIQLERYAVDHGGVYPPSIEAVKLLGYFDSYCENPYYLIDDRADAVVLPASLQDSKAGNVVYHPFAPEGNSLETYILLAKGMRSSSAKDFFYGEPMWDSFYLTLPEGFEKDGHPEGFLIALLPGYDAALKGIAEILGNHPEVILHDANWIQAQPDNRAKSNLSTIQLALERYAADSDGTYPESLDILVEQGYIFPPLNPYAELIGDAHERMWQVEPWEFNPGGVIYFPFKFPGREDEGYIGYYLGLYGASRDGGRDVGAPTELGWGFYWKSEKIPAPKGFATLKDGINDGIILVLSSGPAEMFADENAYCETGT